MLDLGLYMCCRDMSGLLLSHSSLDFEPWCSVCNDLRSYVKENIFHLSVGFHRRILGLHRFFNTHMHWLLYEAHREIAENDAKRLVEHVYCKSAYSYCILSLGWYV